MPTQIHTETHIDPDEPACHAGISRRREQSLHSFIKIPLELDRGCNNFNKVH